MTPDDAISLGRKAEQMLNDPLWADSWANVREAITAAMVSAKTDEGTLRAKLMLGLMVDLRQHWERAIKDGRITEAQIKLDAEEKKRRFRLFAA